MNDDHGNVLINTLFEELDNVRVVRVLGFSLCENLKRGHGFEADMSATSAMSAFETWPLLFPHQKLIVLWRMWFAANVLLPVAYQRTKNL